MAGLAGHGQKYLAQFVDETIPLIDGWTPDKERSMQVERLVPEAALVMYVRDWPGRLNATQHTRAQRSEDKKTSRRVLSRLMMAVHFWGGSLTQVEEYVKNHQDTLVTKAGTLDWAQWWEDHKGPLTRAIVLSATHASKLGYLKDGNRFINALSNEYRQLDDVLGMLQTPGNPE